MTTPLDQDGASPARIRTGRGWPRPTCLLLLALLVVALDQIIRHFWAPPGGAAEATDPGTHYGLWVLTPTVVTIGLALILRQVVPALAIGILLASCMLVHFPPADTAYGDGFLGGAQLAVEHYLIGAITNRDHAYVMLFTFTIGGMVGIIAANGGTAAIVNAVARWATNRRRGQLATWFAGLLVFFDDYANAMIVGPAMRPVCDRLKISRAKLSYIVDSTAAPVASIALIGTWIGTEIGYIHDGLKNITEKPLFLATKALDEGFAYEVFLGSIPYRFYPILALVMVLLIALLNRDFGPMKQAERECDADKAAADTASSTGHLMRATKSWHAGVPVLVLLGVTLALLIQTGWSALREKIELSRQNYATLVATQSPEVSTQPATPEEAHPYPVGVALVREVITNGKSYRSLLWGALSSLIVAAAISMTTGTLNLAQTVSAATTSMTRMFTTIMVLVLAWTLSASMKDLHLGEVARALLQDAQFDPRYLPLLVFISACVVSFATGTSYGTMGILCPAVITIAAGLLMDMPAAQAEPIFYAAVGAVLAGSVFGDHCSPISDTTVLSALATDCSLESHVWTQMPYAIVVAVVGVVSGDALCRFTPVPWWGALLIGTALLLLILLIFGRRPNTGSPTAPVEPVAADPAE